MRLFRPYFDPFMAMSSNGSGRASDFQGQGSWQRCAADTAVRTSVLRAQNKLRIQLHR
jgi:hypothetical protein